MPAASSPLDTEFIKAARSELAECHQKLRHCAMQLTDEQLWSRSDDSLNSIANLLLHLCGNLNERLVCVIHGQPAQRDRDAEFAARSTIAGSMLLEQLALTIARADEALEQLTPARLVETCRFRMLRGEVERPVVQVIVQTLVHLGGHTQEIVTLTRQLLGDRYRFLQSPPAASSR